MANQYRIAESFISGASMMFCPLLCLLTGKNAYSIKNRSGQLNPIPRKVEYLEPIHTPVL